MTLTLLAFALLTGSAQAQGPQIAPLPRPAPRKQETAQSLRYRQLAREMEIKLFNATSQRGAAINALKRAEGIYERATKSGNAASPSDKTMALVEVITQKVEVKRAEYNIFEATTLEESWRLQAEWALSGIANPKLIAEQHVQLREHRLQLLQDLVNDVEPLVAALDTEFGRVKTLREQKLVTLDEYENIALKDSGARGLQVLANNELTLAKKHVVEAKADLDTFTAPK